MAVAILPCSGVSHVTTCEVFEKGATRSVMASVLMIVEDGISGLSQGVYDVAVTRVAAVKR